MKRFIRAVVFTVVLFAAVLWPVAAKAEVVMRAQAENGDYLRLFPTACAHDTILAATPPQYREQMHAGEASLGGKVFALCWAALPDNTVGIMYDDGDQGRVPMQYFKPEVTI